MVRRTKKDALATRASLLDAAERLFLAKGVSRTSLNDIAVGAGTPRGAIYWHSKDKAALINATMARGTPPPGRRRRKSPRRSTSSGPRRTTLSTPPACTCTGWPAG